MGTAMEIKYADHARITDVIELRIEYFREYYDELTREQENEIRNNLADYFETHLGRDCFVVLAIEDGKAVACAILNTFSKAPNRRMPNGNYAEIYGVFTQKDKRCNGYSSALIGKLLDLARRMGMSFIQLEASEEGITVYRNCGFVEVLSEYTQMKYFFDDALD